MRNLAINAGILCAVIAGCNGAARSPCSADQSCPTGFYCANDGSCSPQPAGLQVSLRPSTAVVTAGMTLQLVAYTVGKVTFAVQEPAGGTIDADGTYHAPASVGTFHVIATSQADPTKSATAVVTVAPVPAPPTLAVPSRVTAGKQGLPASVSAPQGGMTFSWSVSGGSLSSATGASVTFDAGSGPSMNLTCIATNQAGYSALATSATIAILAAPDATMVVPAIVTANKSAYSASVPAQIGVTYEWSITGGAITGAQTGNAIQFTAGDGRSPLIVSVTVTNALGDNAKATRSPSVVAAPDATVTARAFATTGKTVYASVPSQQNVTYVWTVSDGSTITGQGTSAISFGAAAAGTTPTVSATVTNAAGDFASQSQTVTVLGTPSVAIAIQSGATTVDAGKQGLTASVAATQPNATYAWSVQGVPYIGTLPSGPSITYSAPTWIGATYSLVVTETNAAGDTASASTTMQTTQPPYIPALAHNDYSLGNQSAFVLAYPWDASRALSFTAQSGSFLGLSSSVSGDLAAFSSPVAYQLQNTLAATGSSLTSAMLSDSPLPLSTGMIIAAGVAGGPGFADGTGPGARLGGWGNYGYLGRGANGELYITGQHYDGSQFDRRLRQLTPSGPSWVVQTLTTGALARGPVVGRDANSLFMADDSQVGLLTYTGGIWQKTIIAGAGYQTSCPNSASHCDAADLSAANARFDYIQSLDIARVVGTSVNTLFVADYGSSSSGWISQLWLDAGNIWRSRTIAAVAGRVLAVAALDANTAVFLVQRLDPYTAAPEYSVLKVASSDGAHWGTPEVLFSIPWTGDWIDNAGLAVVTPTQIAVYDGSLVYLAVAKPSGWVAAPAAGVPLSSYRTPRPGAGADGTGPQARFYNIQSIATSTNGGLFVLDGGGSVVRQLTPTPDGTELIVTTVVGSMPDTSGPQDSQVAGGAHFGHVGWATVADPSHWFINDSTPGGTSFYLRQLTNVNGVLQASTPLDANNKPFTGRWSMAGIDATTVVMAQGTNLVQVANNGSSWTSTTIPTPTTVHQVDGITAIKSGFTTTLFFSDFYTGIYSMTNSGGGWSTATRIAGNGTQSYGSSDCPAAGATATSVPISAITVSAASTSAVFLSTNYCGVLQLTYNATSSAWQVQVATRSWGYAILAIDANNLLFFETNVLKQASYNGTSWTVSTRAGNAAQQVLVPGPLGNVSFNQPQWIVPFASLSSAYLVGDEKAIALLKLQ